MPPEMYSLPYPATDGDLRLQTISRKYSTVAEFSLGRGEVSPMRALSPVVLLHIGLTRRTLKRLPTDLRKLSATGHVRRTFLFWLSLGDVESPDRGYSFPAVGDGSAGTGSGRSQATVGRRCRRRSFFSGFEQLCAPHHAGN